MEILGNQIQANKNRQVGESEKLKDNIQCLSTDKQELLKLIEMLTKRQNQAT